MVVNKNTSITYREGSKLFTYLEPDCMCQFSMLINENTLKSYNIWKSTRISICSRFFKCFIKIIVCYWTYPSSFSFCNSSSTTLKSLAAFLSSLFFISNHFEILKSLSNKDVRSYWHWWLYISTSEWVLCLLFPVWNVAVFPFSPLFINLIWFDLIIFKIIFFSISHFFTPKWSKKLQNNGKK